MEINNTISPLSKEQVIKKRFEKINWELKFWECYICSSHTESNSMILDLFRNKQCAFGALPNLEFLKKIFDNSVVDKIE